MVEKRRRGAALEDAILDAAWQELLDRGYGGFTMEAVAKRAGTSRPVLARRWASRSDLVVAAIANYNQSNPVRTPDLGNVRDELVSLLQKFSDRGARTMLRVLLSMGDYFLETDTNLADLRRRLVGDGKLKEVLHRGVGEVLQRGVERGELDQSRLTPRISTLPIDLIRHEVLMTHRPVSKKVIEEIIDTIFLPLVTARPRRN
ncbi:MULTISPECIES: TetR/AcrR family transcriptional regulator [Bradyrhizobium]|nr:MULTISPECIES: TetR/AcrR family transcriptional regulator [Bradyrhizobium]MBK5653549.1 TetR/AcrR family transcriptional regulator [Rhizobium sp.]